MDEDVSFQFEMTMDDRLTAHMALAEKKDKLWELCKEFIEEQGNSDSLVEGIFDIFGYCGTEDDGGGEY